MFRFSLLWMVLGCTVTFAQTKESFQLKDIYNLEFVSDPQISPDGKKIIYTRNFKDIMTDKNLSNLWIINSDGTQNRPLTTGNQSDRGARWSNNGKMIAYRSNKGGNTQIYLKWMDTAAEAKISNLTESPGNLVWSPDDRYLAFSKFVPATQKPLASLPAKPAGAKWNENPVVITDLNYRSDGRGYLKPGSQHIFVISTDGGTARRVTSGDKDHGSPIWSKDGKYLLFSANLNENSVLDPANSEVYELTLGDGSIKALTERKGPDNNPKISTDGKKIAYLGYDDEFKGFQQAQLYVMNRDGSNAQLITKNFDRRINNFYWVDNKTWIIQYIDAGTTKLSEVGQDGKVSELADHVDGLSLGRPYNAGSFSVSSNGDYAYTLGSTAHPAELGFGSNGSNKKLTHVNQDLAESITFGAVEEIWYESSFDGQKIQGWIVKPPNFDPSKKYPLILEIHGGPFASYGSVFSAEIQLYAAAGYVVLYTNPRGSSGYGYDFGNLIHHNYPNQDYDDLMSGVDEVIKKGYVDENKLYVTGGSGGGVLTAWIIGKTDRFKAAVVAKPVINWYSFVLYADGPAFFYKYWFPGYPWDHVEHYMKRSPISLVENVKTPTMLLTGESDFRTPIAETEQYYAALKLMGVESVMVRIPNASHGIASMPSNLMAKVAYILKWFEEHE